MASRSSVVHVLLEPGITLDRHPAIQRIEFVPGTTESANLFDTDALSEHVESYTTIKYRNAVHASPSRLGAKRQR